MRRPKRMMNSQIVTTDAFIAMTDSTKLLYFYLCLMADDDGFIDSVNMIVRMTGCPENGIDELLDKGYLLRFDSGAIAITHWCVHNNKKQIKRYARYQETKYKTEKAQLYETDEGEYTLDPKLGHVINDTLDKRTTEKMQQQTADDILDDSMDPPEDDEEQPAADPEAEAKAAKQAAAKKAKAEEDKAVDEMMQQLLDMYPKEKRTQLRELNKTVKKKLYKLGMAKVTEALNRYLDSMCGRETYIYGAGNFFKTYIYNYMDEETATPSTPAPAAAPETPAAAPLPQMPLDDDFIPDF